MPITTDILRRLQQFDEGSPLGQRQPQQSPFLKIPNSELLSKITRGQPEPIPTSQPSINSNIESRPNLDPSSGLPMTAPGANPDALSSLGQVQRVNPGQTQTAGMTPVDRDQAYLDILKSSSPRSKVTMGDGVIQEDAPRPKGGFKERLLKALEGGVIGMGQIAGQNARSGREQTLESLLGGGAVGAATGGISPITIDALKRQSQIGQAEGDLERQQGLEGQRVAIDAARTRPMIEAEKLRQEGQRQQDAIDRQNKDLAERADYHKATIAERQADRQERINKPQPQVPDVVAQNAPDIQGLNERIGGYQAELKQHQDEIATKNAAIRKQAEANYQQAVSDYNTQIAAGEKPAKPKRADFYEEEKNNDKDYLDGTVEKVNTRIKELQDAIKSESGNLNQLKTESRKSEQKPRAVKPAGDGKFHYTMDQIRAAAGANFDDVYAKLKANPKVVID